MTNIRVGTGYDVHRLEAGLPFILGGIEIDYHKGMVAHSDGDVLLHAVCDALLGAAALGDIGHIFPDDDPKNQNMDSSLIVDTVLARLGKLSYQLINLDITIILEKPKLQSLISRIRKSVATLLKVSIDQVSIKATTSEKMGFIGKEEGIACYATVLIEKDKL